LRLHVLAFGASFFMLLGSRVGLRYLDDSYIIAPSIKIFKHIKIEINRMLLFYFCIFIWSWCISVMPRTQFKKKVTQFSGRKKFFDLIYIYIYICVCVIINFNQTIVKFKLLF
jgi:hypothetical protein